MLPLIFFFCRTGSGYIECFKTIFRVSENRIILQWLKVFKKILYVYMAPVSVKHISQFHVKISNFRAGRQVRTPEAM